MNVCSFLSLASWAFAWPAGGRESDLDSGGLERQSEDSALP